MNKKEEEQLELKEDYIQYLMFLYDLEIVDGVNVGKYPTFDQFLQIRKEEAQYQSRAIH